jgi:hypothetical protein
MALKKAERALMSRHRSRAGGSTVVTARLERWNRT